MERRAPTAPATSWRGARGVVGAVILVGVDVNLRCLGVGIVIKHGVREALRVVGEKAAKYGLEVAALKNYVAIYGGIGFGVPGFDEYVKPAIKSLAEKYAAELEVIREVGVPVKPVEPRLRGGIPEADVVMGILRSEIKDAGLIEVPPLFNEELEWLVVRASRRWEAAYKFGVNRAAQKIASLARKLMTIEAVVIKMEDLVTIHGKAVANPKTRRWCYAYIQKAVVRWLPPIRIGLSLIHI